VPTFQTFLPALGQGLKSSPILSLFPPPPSHPIPPSGLVVQDMTNLNLQLEVLQGYVKTQKALRKNKQTKSHVLGVVGYLRMELANTSKQFQRLDPIASSFFLCISTGPQEAAGSMKVLHPHQFSCAHQGHTLLSGKTLMRVPQWVSLICCTAQLCLPHTWT